MAFISGLFITVTSMDYILLESPALLQL